MSAVLSRSKSVQQPSIIDNDIKFSTYTIPTNVDVVVDGEQINIGSVHPRTIPSESEFSKIQYPA